MEICGELGLRVIGIGDSATFSQETTPQGWAILRGRHPINQFPRDCLSAVPFAMDPLAHDFFSMEKLS